MNEPELLPEEAKKPRRRRGILVMSLDDYAYQRRGIKPEDGEQFSDLDAHDVDVNMAMTVDGRVLSAILSQSAGPKRGENARMTIWAEIPRWLRWTGIKPVLVVRVERGY